VSEQKQNDLLPERQERVDKAAGMYEAYLKGGKKGIKRRLQQMRRQKPAPSSPETMKK